MKMDNLGINIINRFGPIQYFFTYLPDRDSGYYITTIIDRLTTWDVGCRAHHGRFTIREYPNVEALTLIYFNMQRRAITLFTQWTANCTMQNTRSARIFSMKKIDNKQSPRDEKTVHAITLVLGVLCAAPVACLWPAHCHRRGAEWWRWRKRILTQGTLVKQSMQCRFLLGWEKSFSKSLKYKLILKCSNNNNDFQNSLRSLH